MQVVSLLSHPSSHISVSTPSPTLLPLWALLGHWGRGRVVKGGAGGGGITGLLIVQRRLLIHFLQYTRCRQGSFPPLKLLIGKINPPLVSSLTIHSPREFNSGQQRRTATYTCDTLFFTHSPALLTSWTHLFPVNPDHVANIKSRCSSIAPPPLSASLWHCALWLSNPVHTQMQFSIPIIAAGLWWFRWGQAPLLLDNANDYIRALWMGPRGWTPGYQHTVLMERHRWRHCGALFKVCTEWHGT